MEKRFDIQKVSMHSLSGRIVYSRANRGEIERFRLNVEEMEQGIYLLRIQTKSNEIVRRLIIQ
jgi:hypothetical protein